MLQTSLTRWNPNRNFGLADRFFNDDFFNRVFRAVDEQEAGATGLSGWAPRADVQELENGFRIDVELPGLGKKDIDLTFEDRVLTISGERIFEGNDDAKGYRRFERAYGKFNRSFTLPNTVDAEGIEAKFKDGILTVTVPKTPEVQPKRIAIS
jgi:HSP20 family protein